MRETGRCGSPPLVGMFRVDSEESTTMNGMAQTGMVVPSSPSLGIHDGEEGDTVYYETVPGGVWLRTEAEKVLSLGL